MAKGTVLIVAILGEQDLENLQLNGNLVTTCTNCRNIRESPNFVHTFCVCLTSLTINSINRPVFIMETNCVFREIRIQFLYRLFFRPCVTMQLFQKILKLSKIQYLFNLFTLLPTLTARVPSHTFTFPAPNLPCKKDKRGLLGTFVAMKRSLKMSSFLVTGMSFSYLQLHLFLRLVSLMMTMTVVIIIIIIIKLCLSQAFSSW
jgi:hypothetical protein